MLFQRKATSVKSSMPKCMLRSLTLTTDDATTTTAKHLCIMTIQYFKKYALFHTSKLPHHSTKMRFHNIHDIHNIFNNFIIILIL